MPFDWITEQAWRQNNRESEWRFGGNKRKTLRVRVLRASTIPATASVTFWDVILLGEGDTEIDLKASGQFPANVLPVRPLIINVTDSASASYNVGDVLTVDADVSVGRRSGIVTPGDAAEDYFEVFPGRHKVLSGAGGGGCSSSFFNLGVYYG